MIRKTKQEKHTYFEMFHKVYEISENVSIFHYAFALKIKKKKLSHFKICKKKILTFRIHQEVLGKATRNYTAVF